MISFMFLLKRAREPVNGWTHLVAALAALIGLVALLLIHREFDLKFAALLIYGLSLVLMFSASASYHLVNGTPEVQRRLRIFDHTAIYLLIAGTYTPVCLQFLTGFWRWGFLGIIWGLALIGITTKLFFLNSPRWLTAGTYLLMGWLAVLAIGEMLRVMPAGALFWMALGGFFFTLGAIGYIFKKPDFYPGVFGFHEVWHIMVILGSLSHFIMVAVYVAVSPA
jgi:hemolysin III